MANDGKFLTMVSGRITQEVAINSSGGSGDANKIPKLDSNGKIDTSMMPTGIGADVKVVPASENLAAGDWVNFWLDSGTVKARKADATAAGKEADGFVLAAVTSGSNASVYLEGTNNQLTSLTAGARYYLSTTPGAGSATAPTGSGNVVQFLGKATSTTEISFEADQGVILA